MSGFNKDSLLFRHRQLAPLASVRVSPLCLGSMNFGEAHKERYGECSKDTAFEILDLYYKEGGNFIDTANGYHNGESEEWLGQWMESRDNRDEMVLATKYSTPYMAGHKDTKIQSNYCGNNVKSLKLSLEASLRKLRTSYVDILYIHWWDYTTSVPELMQALNDVVASGKVLYLGISDTPVWIVAQANQYARDHGLRPFVIYQGMWNASMRDMERDIIPFCRKEGMAIAPYGVLNQGRFQTAEGFKAREKHNPGRNFIPSSERDKQVSSVLEKIANEKGVDLLHVALAYTLQKTPYVFPIIGGRKVEHLQGNIKGLEVELTEDEVAKVESAYEFDPGFPHTFLSGTLFNKDKPRAAEGPEDVWLTRGSGTYDWVKPSQAIRPPKR
ncbi:Norsolorinic acid reductase B [Colletotrichum chlorophyti]|uniref:Norsolorinic acid reductase B n=1 Tax=Colletotrichum chlorophyti TaxID=708187 RepID=A0A1Q8S647_9PEZI|nr:Norsolorinic acid reductase B [Colletotrichum chlorophyti]